MSIQPIRRLTAIRTTAALLGVAALAACTTTVNPPAPAPAASVVVVEPAPAPAANLYTIKSGSYEQWSPSNPAVRTTVYFDDYGNKTTTYNVVDVNGKKTTTVIYNNNDGWVTTYVDGSKSATRTKYVYSAPVVMATPPAERKVIEVVEIAGVKCEGWVATSGGVDTKVWTYKGIPCKTEAGKSVVMETTVIKEEVPSTVIFTLPADVTVQDQ